MFWKQLQHKCYVWNSIWGGKQFSFSHCPTGLGRFSYFVWPVLVSHCFGASALHFLVMQIAIAWSMWLSVQDTGTSDLASDTGTQSPVIWPPTMAHKVQWSGLRHWHWPEFDGLTHIYIPRVQSYLYQEVWTWTVMRSWYNLKPFEAVWDLLSADSKVCSFMSDYGLPHGIWVVSEMCFVYMICRFGRSVYK